MEQQPDEPRVSQRAAAAEATRDAIAAAARALFTEDGYDGASIRAIATRADVDPALVIRHFGSKESLFLQTMNGASRVDEALAGPLRGLGRALVGYYLSHDSAESRRISAALLQAAGRPQVRAEILDQARREVIGPLEARLAGPDAALRASLVWSQVLGLVYALDLDEPNLTSADRAVLARWSGDAIQGLIDG
jgi:AcrR family transcriptional regulator